MKNLMDALALFEGLEYKIVYSKNYGPESFFIKDQLEMSRFVQTETIMLTVYNCFEEDGTKFRGSSSMEIFASLSVPEIRACIQEMRYAAGFVKNPYYPLVTPEKNQPKFEVCVFDDKTLFATLESLRQDFYKNFDEKAAHLAYSEFFVKRSDVRITNSCGVDVAYSVNKIYIEASVLSNDALQAEYFKSYDFANVEKGVMTKEADKMLEIVNSKTRAVATPSFVGNVLLKEQYAAQLFYYYISNANARMVYSGQSTYKVGQHVQGEEVVGDKINIKLVPHLEGSVASADYDIDGFRLQEQTIIENGQLKKLWGNVMSSYYLNIEPTGQLSNYVIEGGSYEEHELKSEPYLEIVALSDFQVDVLTGDFGSEIRLAYLYDGKSIVPVTSGSISGNLKECHNNLKMSKQMFFRNNVANPAIVCLKNVTVSGE